MRRGKVDKTTHVNASPPSADPTHSSSTMTTGPGAGPGLGFSMGGAGLCSIGGAGLCSAGGAGLWLTGGMGAGAGLALSTTLPPLPDKTFVHSSFQRKSLSKENSKQLTSSGISRSRSTGPSSVLAEVGGVEVEQSVALAGGGIPSVSRSRSSGERIPSVLTLNSLLLYEGEGRGRVPSVSVTVESGRTRRRNEARPKHLRS